ncbi:hypothetical protein WMF38_20855 [Sorangium sp. So ce118]
MCDEALAFGHHSEASARFFCDASGGSAATEFGGGADHPWRCSRGLDGGGIDSVAEHLAKQGVQLQTTVSEAPGGWSCDFHDPDAHVLAFLQDEGKPRRV